MEKQTLYGKKKRRSGSNRMVWIDSNVSKFFKNNALTCCTVLVADILKFMFPLTAIKGQSK